MIDLATLIGGSICFSTLLQVFLAVANGLIPGQDKTPVAVKVRLAANDSNFSAHCLQSSFGCPLVLFFIVPSLAKQTLTSSGKDAESSFLAEVQLFFRISTQCIPERSFPHFPPPCARFSPLTTGQYYAAD